MLEKNTPLDSVTAREIMTLDPKTISASALAVGQVVGLGVS